MVERSAPLVPLGFRRNLCSIASVCQCLAAWIYMCFSACAATSDPHLPTHEMSLHLAFGTAPPARLPFATKLVKRTDRIRRPTVGTAFTMTTQRSSQPIESRIGDVESVLEEKFGAVGDFSPNALAQRGLTEGFWAWRDRLIEESSSANPVLQALSKRLGGIFEPSYVLDPETLTYGEFPLDLFFKLVSAAEPQQGDVFCDVGSGCGRLVLAAALLWPETFSRARGIEISPDLHAAASAKVGMPHLEGVCPMEFLLADCHTQPELLKDVDVCFCYSTRMQVSDDGYVTQLAETYRKSFRPGARIITVDRHLPPDGPWDLICEIQGENKENGGTSSGRVWRMR